MISKFFSHDEIINEAKHYIKNDDIDNLEKCYGYLHKNKIEYSAVSIYHKLFIYACSVGSRETIKWLLVKYDDLDNDKKDDLDRNSLRETFFYGKYLIQFYKYENILDFFEDFLNCKNFKISEKSEKK